MSHMLEGKTILVAGAGGGIGNGLALRYAAEGASVVLGDIELATAEEGVKAITEAGGQAIAAMTLHSRIEALVPAEMVDVARAAASTKSRVGRPEDLAAMGALLMSDEGSYITGQVISIDAGTTMRP